MDGGGRLANRIPARLSRAEGRSFALTLAGALAVFAAIGFWRGRIVASSVFGGAAGVMFIAGMVVPDRLGPLRSAWMGMAHAISRVTTPIAMGVIYFVVMSPVAIIMRAFGYDPLGTRRPAGSRWHLREGAQRRSDLTRQF
jgi:Saxitoxin biosynthesis operon protein SxtJ